MIRALLRLLVELIANAIGLVVAAVLLDGMTLGVQGFLIAVGIFTLINAVLAPVLRRAARDRSAALIGSTALGSSLVALIITSLISDSLSISGASNWILATVIVWAAGLIAPALLPILVFRRLREDRA